MSLWVLFLLIWPQKNVLRLRSDCYGINKQWLLLLLKVPDNKTEPEELMSAIHVTDAESCTVAITARSKWTEFLTLQVHCNNTAELTASPPRQWSPGLQQVLRVTWCCRCFHISWCGLIPVGTRDNQMLCTVVVFYSYLSSSSPFLITHVLDRERTVFGMKNQHIRNQYKVQCAGFRWIYWQNIPSIMFSLLCIWK